MSATTRALALLIAASAGALAGACGSEARPERIVVISLDTLRADALESMPALSARAARARAFTRHYAATSCTQPTHATLFTGLAPWQHGVARNGMVLASKRETLAERLRAAGFETSAVVASFPLAAVLGFAQGFDRYEDAFDRKMPYRRWDGLEVGDEAFYSLGAHVAERALAALDEARGARQFFFFHLFDAHAPYGDAAGAGGDGDELWSPGRIVADVHGGADVAEALRDARAAYDRDVAAMDRALELVLARLERDAERFETHVVIFADHGESFGERGVLGHGSQNSDEQLRVPLFVFSPRVAPGSIDVPVGTIDVAATILALAGVLELPAGARDLSAGSIPPAPVFGMRRTFAEPYSDVHADGRVDTISGHEFYVVEAGEVLVGNATEVRRGDGDPLTGERADALGRTFAGFGAALDASEAEELTDPETAAILRALGYVR